MHLVRLSSGVCLEYKTLNRWYSFVYLCPVICTLVCSYYNQTGTYSFMFCAYV